MRRGNLRLLDPQTIDVILEPEPGRKERWQTVGVVVACHPAIHPPVLVGHARPEVHQDVGVVQGFGIRLGVVLEYAVSWLRPQENLGLTYPPELARGLPARLQELVGYNLYPPFLGYVDGKHPAELLR